MTVAQRRLLHDSLLGSARLVPDKTALIVGDRAYSYAELLDSALRLARGLQELGLERGDRVAIYMRNDWPCVVSIYAVLIAGGVVVNINPQTREPKVVYMLEDSEAAFLLADAQLLEPFERRESLVSKATVCAAASGRRLPGQRDFLELLSSSAPDPAAPGTIPLDLAAIIYTSGSTGQPKGVMMSHQSMVFIVGSVSQYLELRADDRILSVLPLAFSYGLYQLLLSADLGSTLILQTATFPAELIAGLEKHTPTVFPAVPTIFSSLISASGGDQLRFPRMTRVTNAGAALPAAFVPQLERIFPNAFIYNMYGLTECKRVCYLDPGLIREKPTSVGKAIPGTEVLLLGEDGKPVGPQQLGILHVRGPHLMLGYWKQPELTGYMLKDGPLPGERMLCTHDYFKMDEEGHLYFVARSDDMIKTRGEKVSPLEIENVLYDIPGVREAAVVGVPDQLLGQAVCAYLVLDEGCTLTEKEIRKVCLSRLESLLVPSRITVLPELPKTATGKVRKKSLVEAAA